LKHECRKGFENFLFKIFSTYLSRDRLHLAPLQSFTTHQFRNAFQAVLGDVDRFYAPYLKMNNDGSIKEGPKLDVLPKNNPYDTIVPQVLACCSQDFLTMVRYLEDLGYEEVNWNLGCPYPMVAKRDLGSGILNKPDKIIQILSEVSKVTNLKIGLKMRMGYESTKDILDLLPELNAFPLTEIIVHARYGKQLYNGTCDHDRFEECLSLSKHKLIYNGDITTVAEFKELKRRFPQITDWMIGRGAISNPFLFEMIQEGSHEFPEDWQECWFEFLEHLLQNHLENSLNEGNVIKQMIHYWEYFAEGIPNGKSMFRLLKKAKSLTEYLDGLELCKETLLESNFESN